MKKAQLYGITARKRKNRKLQRWVDNGMLLLIIITKCHKMVLFMTEFDDAFKI